MVKDDELLLFTFMNFILGSIMNIGLTIGLAEHGLFYPLAMGFGFMVQIMWILGSLILLVLSNIRKNIY